MKELKTPIFRIAIQSLKRVNELEQTKTKKTNHV